MPSAGQLGLIVFSHANSFPASTYRQHFSAWEAAGYELQAIEKFGHDAHYPVTDSWPHLERQLLDHIDRQLPTLGGRPLYLVGHSLGGYLSLMAGLRRASQVSGIVLLDAPLIAGWRAAALRLAKSLRLVHRVSPGRVSATRRNQWRDPQEAAEHFGAKPMFQRWQPQVLADYLACGIEPMPSSSQAPAAHTLAFTREVETMIYNTLPHAIMARVRRAPPSFPVAFVAGQQSHELRQVGMAATRRLAGQRISWVSGSHLFPFEQPEQTVAEVLRWLDAFAAHNAAATAAHRHSAAK